MARARGAARPAGGGLVARVGLGLALGLALALVAAGARPAAAEILAVRTLTRPALSDGERTVDEVLAEVEIDQDEHPPIFILRSEFVLYLALERALARGGAEPLADETDPQAMLLSGNAAAAPAGPPPAVRLDDADVRALLERLIGERLLARDALRAADPEPAPAQLEQERMILEERLARMGGSEPVLHAAGADDADVAAYVRRKLVARQYLRAHLPNSIRPSDVEVHEAYESERIAPFRARGESLPMVRGDIVEALMREHYPRAVESYLRSVGSRVRVRAWVPTRRAGGA